MNTRHLFFVMVCLSGLLPVRASYTRQTFTGWSVSQNSASVSCTYDKAAHTLNYTYAFPGCNGNCFGVWLVTTTGFGGPYGSVIFDLNSGNGGQGSGNVLNVQPGQWYQIAARTSWQNGDTTDYWSYFQIPVVEPTSKKWEYENNQDYPVSVQLRSINDPNLILGTQTVYPHMILSTDVFFPSGVSGASVLVAPIATVKSSDGNSFYTSVGDYTAAGTVMPDGNPGVKVEITPPVLPKAPAPATNNPDPNSAPTGDIYNTNITTTSSLTASVFADGIRNITDSLAKIWARLGTVGGGSGGGGSGNVTITNLSGVEGRIDTGNGKLDAIKDKVTAEADDVKAIKEKLNPTANTHENPTADLNQAASLAANVTYSGAKENALSAGDAGYSGVTGSEWGNVTVGATVVHFNPFNWSVNGSSASLDVMTAGRAIILVALAIGFLKRCGDDITRAAIGLSAVPQAGSNEGVENLVPGVAQTKTWGAAGAITLAIFVLMAALVAAADAAAHAISSAVSVGALGSAFSGLAAITGTMAVANQVFPLSASVMFVLLDAVRPYFVLPLYLTCASVIKFAKA